MVAWRALALRARRQVCTQRGRGCPLSPRYLRERLGSKGGAVDRDAERQARLVLKPSGADVGQALLDDIDVWEAARLEQLPDVELSHQHRSVQPRHVSLRASVWSEAGGAEGGRRALRVGCSIDGCMRGRPQCAHRRAALAGNARLAWESTR